MKKNYILTILLLIVNLFSTTAKTEEAFSTQGLCKVTIEVDKGSNIKATTMDWDGPQLTLEDGTNEFQLDDGENPLLIEAAEGAKIISCKVNGKDAGGGDGKLGVGITEGLHIVITTESLANPIVTFSVTDPSHLIVKADDVVVDDISSPKEFTKGTMLTIAPANGYEIKRITASNKPEVPLVNGMYSIRVDEKMTVYVTSVSTNPVVIFKIDFPERISVVNQSSGEPVDISSLKVSIPKGTVLEIQASDEKYSIKSFKVNGKDKEAAGGSSVIYNVGVTGNMIVAIETSSTSPSVKFIVDNAENVKIHKLDSEEMLDVTKAYEMEKNTQLVIEPASDEIRIASVLANGFKLTPLGNGTYMTAVATDMTIEVKTKGILPALTFKVDFPERINVMKGAEKLDISDVVELPAGTEITIEPAENSIIKSVKAEGKELEAGPDGKYQVTVSGDMEFDIRTAASLLLHIVQPEESGTVSVFRDGKELHEGDRVMTNEVLTFKNTPATGYFFINYMVNDEECIDTYTVSGSSDITVSAVFRAVKDDYVVVTFELDELGRIVHADNIDGSERIKLDPTKPCEVKKGSKINVYIYTVDARISSCMMNGVEVPANEGKEGKEYTMTVEKNSVIKVKIVKWVGVMGGYQNDENMNYNKKTEYG